ncbi:biotin synthase BioB [Desulfuromonas sp. AOP6]|uniref:biotin synthase BioB n=1 Tax=Desulfuromonas sp. AOP6 TaxID=1566351 RepID=UPI00126AC28F|nr:biotin synthase [Desulfuromonas sp. AOP6]
MTKRPLDITEKVLAGERLNRDEALAILKAEGSELGYFFAGAQRIKEKYHSGKVSLCAIINAKSGICPENCAFCAQSSYYQTDAPVFPLKDVDEIFSGAQFAQQAGAHCYGIVTSGTAINGGDELQTILKAVRKIRQELAIEPSASLGLLDHESARALAEAGCITYHHNLETAPSFFPEICTTHPYEADLATVRFAKSAGMRVCSGGILGLGETLDQRIELAETLRDLEVDSVPINFLAPVKGTPLENSQPIAPMDCLRAIAMFRFILPDRSIRVCGGREKNLREMQSMIFMAGANGVMVGNYLTVHGRNIQDDKQMIMDAEGTVHEF